jgi:hypothetical protein
MIVITTRSSINVKPARRPFEVIIGILDTLEGRAVQSLTCRPGRSCPHLVQTSADALESRAHRFDLREVDLFVGISAFVK